MSNCQTQMMQSHINQKMSLLGVSWKWKIYLLQQSNLTTRQWQCKQDNVNKQTFTYKDEKHEENTVQFCDYYDHLKRRGFKWKDSLISYEIKISSGGKNLIKTFKHPYDKKSLADETFVMLVYKSTKEEECSFNYIKQIPRHVKHNKEDRS